MATSSRVTVQFQDRVASFFSFWEALVEVADMSGAKLTFSSCNDAAGTTTALVSWNGKAIAKSTKRSLHEAQNEAARLVLTNKQLLGYCMYSQLSTYSGWTPPDEQLSPRGSNTPQEPKPIRTRTASKTKAARQRPPKLQVQLPSSFHDPQSSILHPAGHHADTSVSAASQQSSPSLSPLSLQSPSDQQHHLQLLQSAISHPHLLLASAGAMDLMPSRTSSYAAQTSAVDASNSTLQQLAGLSLPSPPGMSFPSSLSLARHLPSSAPLSLAIVAQLASAPCASLPSPPTINLPTPTAFSFPSHPSINLPHPPALSIPPLSMANLCASLPSPSLPLFSPATPPLSLPLAAAAAQARSKKQPTSASPPAQQQHDDDHTMDDDDTVCVIDQLSCTEADEPLPAPQALKRQRTADLDTLPTPAALQHLAAQQQQQQAPRAAAGSHKGDSKGVTGSKAAGAGTRAQPPLQEGRAGRKLQQGNAPSNPAATSNAAGGADGGASARLSGSGSITTKAGAPGASKGAGTGSPASKSQGGSGKEAALKPGASGGKEVGKRRASTAMASRGSKREVAGDRKDWGSKALPLKQQPLYQHYDSDVVAGASSLFALMQSAS